MAIAWPSEHPNTHPTDPPGLRGILVSSGGNPGNLVWCGMGSQVPHTAH